MIHFLHWSPIRSNLRLDQVYTIYFPKKESSLSRMLSIWKSYHRRNNQLFAIRPYDEIIRYYFEESKYNHRTVYADSSRSIEFDLIEE
jgi:hypothetical protein